MKNFLLVSNAILLLLVGYLYYVHFAGNTKNTVAVKTTATGNTEAKPNASVVAYLDLDSLQSNYDYYKKIKVEFEKKQQNSDNEISSMQKRYQTRAMQLQQKGPQMNQQEQEAAMKEIGQMQQDLQAKKTALDNQLFEYNTKMKDDILKKIQDFLKVYNKDGKYAYIFSYEPGIMFYKDTSLNITQDVIEGLNKDYRKDQK